MSVINQMLTALDARSAPVPAVDGEVPVAVAKPARAAFKLPPRRVQVMALVGAASCLPLPSATGPP